MLKVFVDTPKHLSQAMFRVERALKKYAPNSIEIVESADKADLHVLHVIGADALTYKSPAPRVAVIQYCLKTAGGDLLAWKEWWDQAVAVWSYYNLGADSRMKNFYHAPLGLDPVFVSAPAYDKRAGILTSGYVHGVGAEAIQEPAFAADKCGMPTIHLGPDKPHGMSIYPREWKSINGCNDEILAGFYGRMQWVSGLRYVEGFELPVIEGLACGARPIVFDRPETRYWFNGHAVFVPEISGSELIDHLTALFIGGPEPVTTEERRHILQRFSWDRIISGFWAAVGAGL